MPHTDWRLASHVVAALLGGYFFALAAGVLIAATYPAARSDATLVGHMISVAVYAAAIIWAFSARHHGRAWLAMLLPGVVMLVAGLLISGYPL